MQRRLTAALIVAALAPALLAACGEKEEPATTGPVVAQTTTGGTTTPNGGGNGGADGQPATDEELIKATITEFLTKPKDPTKPADPSVCDELITEGFLKEAYGNRKNCVESRMPGALADRATILGRKPGPGGSTVVTVKPEGGVFGGQTLQVTVVEAGGAFKIDEISGDAKVGP